MCVSRAWVWMFLCLCMCMWASASRFPLHPYSRTHICAYAHTNAYMHVHGHVRGCYSAAVMSAPRVTWCGSAFGCACMCAWVCMCASPSRFHNSNILAYAYMRAHTHTHKCIRTPTHTYVNATTALRSSHTVGIGTPRMRRKSSREVETSGTPGRCLCVRASTFGLQLPAG